MTTPDAPETLNLGYVHGLIAEYRQVLASSEWQVPVATGGVVVLSAQEFVLSGGVLDPAQHDNDENIARIELGIEVSKAVAADRLGKDVDDLTDDDLINHAPPLILNGTTQQLPHMQTIADQLGFPVGKTNPLNCGPAGKANTKTQFEAIGTYVGENRPSELTFISSAYHVPRVVRTGNANLDSSVRFSVIHVPHERVPIDVGRIVMGEVRRVRAYADKGDISKHASRDT